MPTLTCIAIAMRAVCVARKIVRGFSPIRLVDAQIKAVREKSGLLFYCAAVWKNSAEGQNEAEDREDGNHDYHSQAKRTGTARAGAY